MTRTQIEIEYDGDYPNLCSGALVVTVDGRRWEFPSHCMSSGGSVGFDDDWNEHVYRGGWSITSWPDDFPSDPALRKAVVSAVNGEVEHGCCGGCV